VRIAKGERERLLAEATELGWRIDEIAFDWWCAERGRTRVYDAPRELLKRIRKSIINKE
jgi:hypothetical protein